MKEYQPKIEWTPEQDALIIAARSSKPPMPYDELCKKLGYARWTVICHTRELGFIDTRNGLVPPQQVEIPPRDGWLPLPAGHPLTWGAICRGQPWPGRSAIR